MNPVQYELPAPWMRWILRIAGLYHAGWGIWFVLAPRQWFVWGELGELSHPWLVQGLGAGLAALGLAYVLAAANPQRHVLLLVFGTALKVCGLLGTGWLILRGELPDTAWAFTLINDALWLPAFGMLLARIYREEQTLARAWRRTAVSLAEAGLERFADQHGQSLQVLQHEKPVLLVFLRHFGCTFCREVLADLGKQQAEIAGNGLRLVLVHQSPEERATEFFARYDLGAVSRISDPKRKLYQRFSLPRARLDQVFGWKNWWRGLIAGALKGHWVGREEGDGWQMPGSFVIHRGQILAFHRPEAAADHPDYLSGDICELQPEEVSGKLTKKVLP